MPNGFERSRQLIDPQKQVHTEAMMALKRKWPYILLLVLVILVGAVFAVPRFLNRYQREGSLNLPGLKGSVRVCRDEKGMAYIYADQFEDVLMGQGFITAQDRLFQMALTRLFSSGRISELVGEEGKSTDIRMRTLGFRRKAEAHAKILSPETRRVFKSYADGVNAYIEGRAKTHPLEFKLAGIQPEPWKIEDSLAIMYYMGWDSAGNLDAEIVCQMLVDKLGPAKAKDIFPLLKNPDAPSFESSGVEAAAGAAENLHLSRDSHIAAFLGHGILGVGSNNWAVGPGLSAGGKPIVSNDPHLDARILPGPWYPCGLILPQVRAVGVNIPGVPAMVVGRTSHFAIGVTNAYGDAQDLFVETLDPANSERYLEGDRSIPFEVIEETLRIKDKEAPGGLRKETIRIRSTTRGPVVSGVLPGGKTQNVMTLRWAPFETMGPSVGIEKLFTARNIDEVRDALSHINVIMLNFVFADVEGNIGWQVSSRIPVRSEGDGALPYRVRDGRNHWVRMVGWEEMPHAVNPERGWVGTCNHLTVTADYPYYYSSHVSASYRYERLKEILEGKGKHTAEDHRQYQQDTLNLMAKRIAPIMAEALSAHEDTREMGRILKAWDFRDDTDKAAPAVFQTVYRQFARQVFKDELGEALARHMLDQWTFWQERLEHMVLEGNSQWFDDVKTGTVKETRDELFHRAGVTAKADLEVRLGKDPSQWRWGDLHRIEFVSPIRREGLGKDFLGGGSHPFPGSAETLCRGMFDFTTPYQVTVSDSLRMVADLSDADKVMAVLPGGVAARIFHPNTTDQIDAFVKGKTMYWWFSDPAIREHTRAVLHLEP